jgi:Mg2+ and Co2+ transporter CorA
LSRQSEEKVQQLTTLLEQSSASVQEKIQQLLQQYGERKTPSAPKAQLLQRIRQIEAHLEEHQRLHGDPQQIFETFEAKKQAYTQSKKALMDLKDVLDHLAEAEAVRKNICTFRCARE